METNMRFADELLRRTGPSTVVDLQRQFLREYFDALAQGGTCCCAPRGKRRRSRCARWSRRCRSAAGGGAAAAGRHGKVADVMSKDVKLASPRTRCSRPRA
jgi:hypothetical protein